jgi:hypothetical protein
MRDCGRQRGATVVQTTLVLAAALAVALLVVVAVVTQFGGRS